MEETSNGWVGDTVAYGVEEWIDWSRFRQKEILVIYILKMNTADFIIQV
jgi:hypothetical protein